MPVGYYSGNRYGADINNGQGHLPPCGYEPEAMQTAYGLTSVYGSGLDGTGQTVVVVDAFGSPTAAADIAKFSSTFSLPAPNFAVFDPQGPPPYNSGWAGETTLDIEWSHAMAPGAKVVLIEAIDNFDNNLMGGIQYSLDNTLGECHLQQLRLRRIRRRFPGHAGLGRPERQRGGIGRLGKLLHRRLGRLLSRCGPYHRQRALELSSRHGSGWRQRVPECRLQHPVPDRLGDDPHPIAEPPNFTPGRPSALLQRQHAGGTLLLLWRRAVA